MKKNIFFLGVLVVVCLIMTYACSKHNKEQQKSAETSINTKQIFSKNIKVGGFAIGQQDSINGFVSGNISNIRKVTIFNRSISFDSAMSFGNATHNVRLNVVGKQFSVTSSSLTGDCYDDFVNNVTITYKGCVVGPNQGNTNNGQLWTQAIIFPTDGV